jgi:hypothetical protein
MNTDVGYIRPILFYGMFFLIISYIIPILLLVSVGKVSKNNVFVITLLILSLFTFEFKGEVVLQIIPLSYTLFLAETRSISMEVELTKELEVKKRINFLSYVVDPNLSN